MRSTTLIVLVTTSLVFASCGRKPTATELSSDLRQVSSMAAEADLFIERVRMGQITPEFAPVHTAYLLDDLKQAQDKLNGAISTPGLDPALRECQQEQQKLSFELS